MIQNNTHADRTVEGNLKGEDIKMQVGDMSHILNVLTDLYADRELACIREYSTNAWDAHVEAGVTTPIEVTTPTPLSPFLTIRDFGVGLALDDIREVYSQYGISTKRGTNAQNGMLGLGCKSALTYADQFTVTSVKEGVRVQVVVSRNTMGASMKVVDTSTTDEANGTTVVIPARAGNQIEAKAVKFFKYWEEGRVVLNGKPTERLPGAKWVSPQMALIEEYVYGETNRIVMGGVAYPAPNLNVNMGSYSKLVAFVEIGKVDFAPSREALMDTDTTTATIKAIQDAFAAALAKSIKDDIAAADSATDAVRRRMDWFSKVPNQYIPANTPYKGHNVPDNAEVPADTIVAPLHGRKVSAHSKLTKWAPMTTILGSLWVTGWDHASFTATMKKKLVKYAEDAGTHYDNFVLSKDRPDTFWIEGGTKFIDWDTIKAIKLPRNAPNPTTGRIPGAYDVWEDGDWNENIPGDDIDTSNPVYWMFGKHWDGRTRAEWLHKNVPGATLVMLRRGREDKFARLFPATRPVDEVIREAFDKWASTVSDDVKLAMAVQSDYRLADYEKLDASKIDDPRFAKVTKLRQRDLSKIEAKISEWSNVGMFFDTGDHDIESPLADYPLLPNGYSLTYWSDKMDHLYRYMNSEYAYQKDQA